MSEASPQNITQPPQFSRWLMKQLRQANHQLQWLSSKQAIVFDCFGQYQGKLLHIEQSIPFRIQKETPNLLIIHPDYVAVWQQGKELAQVGWDRAQKWQRLIKQFIQFDINPSFTTNYNTYYPQLKSLQTQLIQAFQTPDQVNASYEEAFRWLYHYLRTYLNPQASKFDVFYFASQFALLYPVIAQGQVLRSNKIIQAFQQLAHHAFDASLQDNIEQSIVQGRALLQLLDRHLPKDKGNKYWEFFRIVNQAIGKKFSQHLIPSNAYIPKFIQDHASEAHERLIPMVSWDWKWFCGEEINTALFIPYLLLLHHPTTQSKGVYWVNSLIAADYLETTHQHPIFSQKEDFNAVFLQQRQTAIPFIYADLSELFHDKAERGYSQAYESYGQQLQVYQDNSIYEQVTLPHFTKLLSWSTHRLALAGTLCCLIPESLLLNPILDGLRLHLTSTFESIQIITQSADYQAKASCWLILTSKGKQHQQLQISHQSEVGNWEKLRVINGFWVKANWSTYFNGFPIKHQHAVTGETLQLLHKAPQNHEHSLFHIQVNGTKWAIIPNSLYPAFDFEEKPFASFAANGNSISPEAIQHFQAYYGAKIPVVTGIDAALVLESVEEISKYSKQLPVIHKYSVQLNELAEENQEPIIPFQKFVTIRAHIDKYLTKIKQLAKGANERKTTFHRISIQLKTLLSQLEEQEQQHARSMALSAAINKENITFYCFYALAKAAMSNYIPEGLATVEARIYYHHDFHAWANYGRQLAQLFQFDWPIAKQGSLNIQSVKSQGKISFGNEYVIEHIPAEVWDLSIFGKSLILSLLKNKSYLSKQLGDNQQAFLFFKTLIKKIIQTNKMLTIR